MNIYLAGKVAGIKWQVTKKLNVNATFVASDGSNHSEHLSGCGYFEFNTHDLHTWVEENALQAIRNCDFLLAILDTDDSYGSIAEIAYASAQGKPCFVIVIGITEYESLGGHGSGDSLPPFWDVYWFVTHFPGVSVHRAFDFEAAVTIAQNIGGLSSPIELELYQAMCQQYILREVETQKRIGKYRADFSFPHRKLIVETDGQNYHASVEQRTHDAARDRFLSAQGWRVLRFTGTEIKRNVSGCVNEICKAVRQ